MHPSAFHPATNGKDYEMPEVLRVLEKHRMTSRCFPTWIMASSVAIRPSIRSSAESNWSTPPDTEMATFSLDQRLGELCRGQLVFASMTLEIPVELERGGRELALRFRPSRVRRTPSRNCSSTKTRVLWPEPGNLELVAKAFSTPSTTRGKRWSVNSTSRTDSVWMSTSPPQRNRIRTAAVGEMVQTAKPDAPTKFPGSQPERAAAAVKLWYDVSLLALTTDSSRVITLAPTFDETSVDGVTRGHHRLSPPWAGRRHGGRTSCP